LFRIKDSSKSAAVGLAGDFRISSSIQSSLQDIQEDSNIANTEKYCNIKLFHFIIIIKMEQ